MGSESEDMESIEERAKKLSELTGREYEDVLTDLLDDGKLNNSHIDDEPTDLVEQLKGAAELIATVQNISQDIQDNSVLNGGDNETVVEVKTTLEGDIVDRAIESVQRKAENIRKIVLIIAPIILLLTGGVGLDYFMGDGDGGDSDWDDDYYDIWGCTAPDAENFMPDATVDDGSCYWDDNNGGGGGPPPVNCQWSWDDFSFLDNDDHLVIRANFGDDSCPHEMEGRFTVELHKDGYYQTEHSWENIKFKHNYEINFIFSDLEQGVYRNHFIFETYDGSNWNWDSPETHEVMEDVECSAFLQNQNAFIDEDDEEQNAVKMSVDIAIPSEVGDACDSHQFELTWRLYVDSQVQYEEHSWEDGWISDSDRADYASFTIDDVAVGTYDPRIILKLDGDTVIDEKWLSESITVAEQAVFGCTDSEATNYNSSATDDDGSCEYPSTEPCDVEIHNHYRGHVADDAEQDAILVAFRVVPSNCEGEMVEIDIELFQNGYDANYTHWVEVNGDNEYTDVSHIFDGVAVGNSWTPTIIASLDDEVLEQVWFWGIDVVEQEPETCEINLFDIELITNNTTATVGFDLDCGYEENDLEGYNVSVQFLIYHVNETNSGANGTGPLEWTTQLYYIEGYADDVRVLTLNNFTVENITHYDFYWYAIWEDSDGNQQYIEMTWLNRELSP